MKTLGQRIKHHRKLMNLSQGELGKIVGVDQTVISKLECGEMSESTKIARLARALRVDAYWLDTGDGLSTPAQIFATLTPTPPNIQDEAVKLLAEMDRDDMTDWLDTIRIAANKARKQKQDAAEQLLAQSRAAKKAGQSTEEADKELPKQPLDPPQGTRRAA